jgi:hypothetical protein
VVTEAAAWVRREFEKEANWIKRGVACGLLIRSMQPYRISKQGAGAAVWCFVWRKNLLPMVVCYEKTDS